MIKVLIVDDEPRARENLRLLLNEYCKDVEVVAECRNGEEALNAMERFRLDLAFLDIQMPGMSGIELAERAKEYAIPVVFATAHDEFAVKAFRLSALDYLLKPVMPEELVAVIDKAKQSKVYKTSAPQLEIYRSISRETIDRIALPVMNGLEICMLNDIVLLKADESYTEVLTADGKTKVVSRKMGEMEELLADLGFLRIHKSYMVNQKHIRQYIKGEGGQVKMSNGMVIDVARRKKEDLLNKMNRI